MPLTASRLERTIASRGVCGWLLSATCAVGVGSARQEVQLADVLIREAIERAVDYDDWFIREVENGLAQIDAGQVLTHDAVGARLEQKLAERRSHR
jgi:predicted transcriptional regulator